MNEIEPIIYQNDDQSIILIDIPTSIEAALEADLHPYHNPNPRKRILSSEPLEHPYPNAPEPKSEAARNRLVSRIPESEIVFHDKIEASIRAALDHLRNELRDSKWCKSRIVRDDCVDSVPETDLMATISKSSKKRKLPRRGSIDDTTKREDLPPLILTPSATNRFTVLDELCGVEVRNPSGKREVRIQIQNAAANTADHTKSYIIPTQSSFILCNLSAINPDSNCEDDSPIPGLRPGQKFDLIIFDPPWPNRSVRRSSQYSTHSYLEMGNLTALMQQIVHSHLRFQSSSTENTPAIVGIWTTNNAKSRQTAYEVFSSTGLEVFEIWIWVKTTRNGETVVPLDGLWRKPYEVLFLGRPKAKISEEEVKEEEFEPIQRIIAAVPDTHSRKPSLKLLLEKLFFPRRYTALEVFARNLTVGWTACGNDVLKFNADRWLCRA